MKIPINELKSKFENGDIPTQIDFNNLIDSCYNSGSTSNDTTGFTYSMKNVILVNPDLEEIDGKQYKTWLSADSYISTKSPSQTNRWTILMSGGYNNENIIVKSWVNIKGIKNNTILIGSINTNINFSISAASNYESVIIDCALSNLSLSISKYIGLFNCDIYGRNNNITSMGFYQMFNSTIYSGDWSTQWLQMFQSIVIGGQFGGSNSFYYTELYANYILGTSAEFYHSLILNKNNNSLYNSGTFTLYHTIVDSNITWNHSTTLKTKNCTNESDIITNNVTIIDSKKYIGTYNSMTTFTVSHSLDTKDIIFNIIDTSTNKSINPTDVSNYTNNSFDVTMPNNGNYKVIVIS